MSEVTLHAKKGKGSVPGSLACHRPTDAPSRCVQARVEAGAPPSDKAEGWGFELLSGSRERDTKHRKRHAVRARAFRFRGPSRKRGAHLQPSREVARGAHVQPSKVVARDAHLQPPGMHTPAFKSGRSACARGIGSQESASAGGGRGLNLAAITCQRCRPSPEKTCRGRRRTAR